MISLSGLSYRVFVSERFEPWKPVWPNRWIKRFVMQRAEGVIVQSQSTRELYHALFPEKSIYKIRDPFVQRDIFHAVKKENVVLAVGPLGPNNRLDELIRQFRNHRNPGWKLVITGGDSFFQHYLDKLNETIRELQAEEYVILAGSRLDMNYYYGISKIFAHVSTSAVPSYAMGEAMSAGIPVVGFNLENGDDSIVEHGASGLLAPRGDFHTIGYFLRQLMDYPGLCNKMGTYAQQRMLQFKPMDIGESYYKCLVLDKSMAS